MGNLTLAGLAQLFSANPLTAAASGGEGAENTDFTQLLAGFQAGQGATAAPTAISSEAATLPELPATTAQGVEGDSALQLLAGLPTAATSVDATALGLPADTAAAVVRSATTASAESDTSLQSLMLSSLPGRDLLAGLPAAASKAARSADVAQADGDKTDTAASQDATAQAADLLVLLGMSVQNPSTPLPANTVQLPAATADGISLDQATGGLRPLTHDAASVETRVRAATSVPAEATALPTLSDALKLANNTPANAAAPQALASAVAALADSASRRATVAADTTTANTSAAALTLTPLAGTAPMATSGSSTAAATVTVQLPGHVLNDPSWSDTFRERVALLANQGVQHASIRVTPEGMGPIQVHIAMADQGAQVEFKAQHHATAALIESMLPRLATAMADQGIKLDDARVSAFTRQDEAALQSSLQQDGRQAASQQAGNGERRFAATLGDASGDSRDSAPVATVTPRRSRAPGNLDAYA